MNKHPKKKHTILLACHDSRFVEYSRDYFSEEGFRINISQNGLEAVESVLTCPPDLIILDKNLPEINGMELCQDLRVNPNTQSIPIMLLVPAAYSENGKIAINSPADVFMVKNATKFELLFRTYSLLKIYYDPNKMSSSAFKEAIILMLKERPYKNCQMDELSDRMSMFLRITRKIGDSQYLARNIYIAIGELINHGIVEEFITQGVLWVRLVDK